MKHLFLFISLVLFILLISGCNTFEKETLFNPNPKNKPDLLLIPQDTKTLTIEDAANVALLFHLYQTENNTKAIPERSVESVNTIYDKTGCPAIYAVNFENNQGFVLVSASKNFYPVLAYIEKGHFSPNTEHSGLDIWINQQIELISCARSLPEDSVKVFYNRWSEFENTQSDKPATKTDDLWTLRTAAMAYWQAQGYNCIDLDLSATYLPAEVYEDWCTWAELRSDTNYDYMLSAFVIHKATNSNSQVGPLMSTSWGQDAPYNALLTRINGTLPRAGCSIAAMAQIMRYHEWPTLYNWSSMSNTTGTTATAQLYYDLGRDAQTNYGITGSSTNITNLKNAITGSQYNYNYTATVINHNYSTTVANINNQKPVYMQGYDTSDGSAHAWVCDGYKSSFYNDSYMLVILPPDEPYTPADGYSYDDYYLTSYLYMNWGEEGDANGWFYSDNVAFSDYLYGVLIQFNYSSNRKDIVNITPITN